MCVCYSINGFIVTPPQLIYSKYAEVSDELIKEKEAKELIQNQLNHLTQVCYEAITTVHMY